MWELKNVNVLLVGKQRLRKSSRKIADNSWNLSEMVPAGWRQQGSENFQ